MAMLLIVPLASSLTLAVTVSVTLSPLSSWAVARIWLPTRVALSQPGHESRTLPRSYWEGRLSTIQAGLMAEGPLLVATIVYVLVAPGAITVLPSVLVMSRSTFSGTVAWESLFVQDSCRSSGFVHS